MKKIIISLLLFFFFVCDISASETSLSSKRYILYNLNDVEIIDSKKEHERISIASLTKIMTVITAIENIKDYNEKVTITSDMIDNIDWDVVKVGFKKGEVVTYNDLLYGAILPSGADAVNALAISLSGSEKAFVKKMNEKVKELGLKDTSFSNVVGLYGKNNYSSAYDMAQILMYALKNEKFKSIFETKQYKLSNGKMIYSTLIYYNKKQNKDISIIKGSKTGYIEEAKYCLASTSSINGVDYLLITLNAPNNTSHISDHLKEYNYFSKNYGYKDIINKNDKMLTIENKYCKEKYISIYANEEIKKYLKNDYEKSKNEYEYIGIRKTDFFNNNSLLGHVKIKYNDKELGEFDLYQDKKLHFDVFSFIKHNSLYINTIFFITLFIMYIFNVIMSNDNHFEVDNTDRKF